MRDSGLILTKSATPLAMEMLWTLALRFSLKAPTQLARAISNIHAAFGTDIAFGNRDALDEVKNMVETECHGRVGWHRPFQLDVLRNGYESGC